MGPVLWHDADMPQYLSIADVAEMLNVSAGQIRTLIRNGELRAFQVGGRGQWRISEQDLEEYIERQYARTREMFGLERRA